MALAISELTSAYSNADATTYTTASISPAASSLLLFLYSARHATTAPGITPPSAYGGTWTELGGGEQVDGLTNVGAWLLQCSASPGTAGMTVSVDAAATAIGLSHAILQVTGHDTSTPTTNFVYGPTGTGTAGTSGLVTLAALSDANNAEVAYFVHRANEAQSAEAGWTAGTSRAGTSPNHGSLASWRIASADLSVTQTWTTSARYQALAFEVKIAPAAATTPGVWRRPWSTLVPMARRPR